MLPQDNGKNLSMKETIFVSQDCPKVFGSPLTCGSQRANIVKKKKDFLILGERPNFGINGN